MQRDLSALAERTYDLAIIGGGINGAATAREAALRGLKVALFEARDFSSGTSSRSSKLIHGGLRYLEQFDFKLVHESRTERRTLLALAPHLACPLPFVLPIYRGDPYYPLKIRVGLSIYDLLGNLGRADRHRMLSREEALRLIPGLRSENLRAAAVYYDSETDDARLTLEMILAAAERGANVANYAEIRALETSASGQSPEIVSAEVEDRLTGRRHELAARFWVNAAGPWVDHVRALLPGFDGTKTVRLTKGTHLILPGVDPDHALFAAILPGDRIFLMLPWHGHALLGTTDTDFDGDPANVQPDRADTDYLLAAVNRVLRRPFSARDVRGSFAGLRALAIEPGRSASENTREYRFHEEPGIKNFVSVCGGKLTTARALGEKLVDRIAAQLGAATTSAQASRTTPLPGGNTGSFEDFVRKAMDEAGKDFGVPAQIAERIVRTYGSRWQQVLGPIRESPALAEPLAGNPPLLRAEVQFAIRHEMAANVEDFLVRRSGLNWLAACSLREAAPAVAEIFARELGWSPERRQASLAAFARCCSLPTSP
ncbi:MAG: glycerol-3-phosphate dehydrogenase [Acidobacteriia bacterium]|nr:glycerol-3-phosphate dehydrogenase [Terriglobia bacterium]